MDGGQGECSVQRSGMTQCHKALKESTRDATLTQSLMLGKDD